MIDYQKMANKDIDDGLSHTNVHDDLKELSNDELRQLCDNDRLPFAVCVLNVTGDLNLGTIVRTSLLTGAEKVGIIGRRKYDKRGTVGSENYINVERINGLQDDDVTIDLGVFWKWVEENKYKPFFVEHGGTPTHKVNWEMSINDMLPSKPLFVFGNENHGLPKDLLSDSRGSVISIPQKGCIRSYNVATSAGIVLFDMVAKMGWFDRI